MKMKLKNSKTQNVTTQIATKLNNSKRDNSNCDKLKNSNSEREKLKNSNYDKTWIMKNLNLWEEKNLKRVLLDNRWDVLWAAFCDSRDVFTSSVYSLQICGGLLGFFKHFFKLSKKMVDYVLQLQFWNRGFLRTDRPTWKLCSSIVCSSIRDLKKKKIITYGTNLIHGYIIWRVGFHVVSKLNGEGPVNDRPSTD